MIATSLVAVGPVWAAGVDANTASAAELDALKGLGPALAARIVEERRKAPFRDLADLQTRVKGIGENTIKRLAEAGLSVGEGQGRASGTTAAAAASPAVRNTQLGKGLIRDYPQAAASPAR